MEKLVTEDKCIARRVLLRFRKRPARDTVQQLDKPKETQLSIRVSNPVMKNSMNWDGWANA